MLVAVSIKAALLLAASGVGALMLRRSTPAARHQLWTLGVAGALLLPLLAWALPPLPIEAAAVGGGGATIEAPAILVTPGAEDDVAGATPWLALAWAAGALAVSLRFARDHVAAHRLLRGASPLQINAMRDAAAALGVTRRVRLRRSEAIGSPMTVGILRPRVLLPAAADHWPAERLRAVLVHELAHVRRHDTLIQLGAQLACALYWWNPLAWLAAARLRVEREHACDDVVLGAGIKPSSYASDLLEVARGVSLPAGAIGMVARSGTETRVRRILDARATRRPLRAAFRWAARGAALALAAALACTTAPAATPPLPRISVGAPSINDGPVAQWTPPPQAALLLDATEVDLALVDAEVRRHLGTLQQCYARRLAERPALAGEVIIHWVILPDGKVAEQCITRETVSDPGLLDCVNQLVASGTFPATRGTAVDVSFPFVFAR